METVIDQLISIGEASRMLGLCQDTLREWDKSGKLSPVRTAGSHRRYRLSDIQRIQAEGMLKVESKEVSNGH